MFPKHLTCFRNVVLAHWAFHRLPLQIYSLLLSAHYLLVRAPSKLGLTSTWGEKDIHMNDEFLLSAGRRMLNCIRMTFPFVPNVPIMVKQHA